MSGIIRKVQRAALSASAAAPALPLFASQAADRKADRQPTGAIRASGSAPRHPAREPLTENPRLEGFNPGERPLAARAAIGYVRVSTAEQAAEGVSMEAQRARIQAWADANGYQLVGVHTDAGLSGKRADNRPGLHAALEDACRRKAALVVYSLSRLARSTRDTLQMAERLDKAGADLVSLSERIDTTSAAGRMIFRLLAVLAEFERDLASERTAAALAHKRQRGEKTGGRVPFGFELAADGVNLVEVESEQQVIVLIRALRAERKTYRAIAEELEARGIVTKNGGLIWNPKVVRAICGRR